MSDTRAFDIDVYNDPQVCSDWSHEVGLYPIEKDLIRLHFPPPPARVLDLGCGAGRTTVDLVGLGYSVKAVDLSDELLKTARQRVGEDAVLKMDAAHLEFPDDSFDAVLFSFNGIDHAYPIEKRRSILSEVNRVLVRGGVFYFSCHNASGHVGRGLTGGPSGLKRELAFLGSQFRNRHVLQGYWLYPPHKCCAVTPSATLRDLRKAGFELVGVRGLQRYKETRSVVLRGPVMPRADPSAACPVQRVVGRFLLRWCSPHIQFVAQKPGEWRGGSGL